MTNSVQELRDFLLSGREQLLAVKPSSQPGSEWLQSHSHLIDETLRRIHALAWDTVRAASPLAEPGHEPELALLAIGGYGRGELCPYSDIDIAFVPQEEENPLLDAVVKEAFRLVVEVLIDGAKLDVGYAYRPVSDCAHLDHTAKVALLEARLVAGSERLLGRMREELRGCWDAVEFLLDKTEERRQVSCRAGLSLYAVEPNLKEGVGALREVQTALWVAGAMNPTDDVMRDLEWRGVVTAADCRAARGANDFFLRLRVWLHLTTRKKSDVLRQELQDKCARDFAYTGAGAQPWQNLLRDYYRHAEGALRFSEKVMRRLMEGPLPLDDHFVARHKRVRAAHPHVLRNHPELLMTPFALARKYGFETDTDLDAMVEETLPLIDSATRAHSVMRHGFLSLLHDVGGASDALADLRGRGVLGRFMPEFAAMLHLAPADPSHELTVGEHSIGAVRRLEELWHRRNDDEALFAVWQGVDDAELLVLATLLHDVGKIEPGSDHAVSGARLARRIGERLGLAPDRLDRLARLVRRHLLLPRVARLRDLSSPGTIRDVMEHAGDVATLKMLYLLSLADTRAVGARSYGGHEVRAMQELYQRVLMAMTREETAQALTDSEVREQMAQRERERLRREVRRLQPGESVMQRLVDNLPASYVLNTPLATVATHLKFLEQLPEEKLIVDFYEPPGEPFTEMTVVAYDEPQPGLLSKICGVVWAAGADIHMAQVFTLCGAEPDAAPGSHELFEPFAPSQSQPAATPTPNPQPPTPNNGPIVLDRLHVARDGRPLSPTQSARLAALLREVLVGGKSVEDALRQADKATAVGLSPAKISVRNDLSDEHSVLTLVNDSVPGLLFHITRALAALKLDIHSAKITTWAGRAEDAFYVTRRADDFTTALNDGKHGNGEGNGSERHDYSPCRPGRSHKIRDDEIRDVLEAVRRTLQKPV